MNLLFGRIFAVCVLCTAAVFAASGRPGGEARFHLPMQAHWGSAILQPGDYEMVTPDLSTGQPTFFVRGPEGSVYVLPIITDSTGAAKDECYLKLKAVNGTYFVTQYVAGAAGKIYTFASPKQKRQQTIAEQGGTLVAVSHSALR